MADEIVEIEFVTTGLDRVAADVDRAVEKAERGVTVPVRGDGSRPPGSPPVATASPGDDPIRRAQMDARQRIDAAQRQVYSIDPNRKMDLHEERAIRARLDERFGAVGSGLSDRESRSIQQANERLARAKEREARAAERLAERAEREAQALSRANFGADLAGMSAGQRVNALRSRMDDPALSDMERAQVRGQLATAQRNTASARFLGAPSAMSLYMTGMFGGMEVAGAFMNVRQAEMGAAATTDLAKQYQLRMQAAQSIQSGMLGSFVGLGVAGMEGLTGGGRNGSRWANWYSPEQSDRIFNEGTRFNESIDANIERNRVSGRRSAVAGLSEFAKRRRGLAFEREDLNAEIGAALRKTSDKVEIDSINLSKRLRVEALRDEENDVDREESLRGYQLVRRAWAANHASRGDYRLAAQMEVEAQFDVDTRSGTLQFGNMRPGDPLYDPTRKAFNAASFVAGQQALREEAVAPRMRMQNAAASLQLARQPLAARLAEIQGETDYAMVSQTPARQEEISRAGELRKKQAIQERLDQSQFIGLSQSTRERQQRAMLSDKPLSAEIEGMVGNIREREGRLRINESPEAADRERRLGQGELDVYRRDYLRSFRAREFNPLLQSGGSTNREDDPGQLLANIRRRRGELDAPGGIGQPWEGAIPQGMQPPSAQQGQKIDSTSIKEFATAVAQALRSLIPD